MLVPQPLEKANRFLAVLKQTERLRFETQMQLTVGALARVRYVLRATPQIVTNALLLFGALDEFFKRARRSTDAPLDTRRHQLTEQIEQAFRILEPLRVSW